MPRIRKGCTSGQQTAAEDNGQQTAAEDKGRQRRTRTTDGSGGQRTAAADTDNGRQRRTKGGRQQAASVRKRTTSVSGGLKAADNGRQRQTTGVSGGLKAADNRRRGTPLASVAGHRHQFVEENRYSQMQWRVTTYCSGSGWGPISVWVRGFRRGCRRGRWPGG